MISQDGATLVATLLPIGVLLLALESRSLLREVRPTSRNGRWLVVVLLIATVLASLMATMTCVVCVSRDIPIQGFFAGLVWAASLALIAAVAGVLCTGVAVSVLGDE
jgi:hypothetical protein